MASQAGLAFSSHGEAAHSNSAALGLHFHPGQKHTANPSDLALARIEAAQQLLFPNHPKAVCDEMGLNWWAAIKLFEDGFLSFSPEHTAQLDEAQEAELRFVGQFVIAGCDRPMLTSLLGQLPKPYSYRSDKIYYEWGSGAWRLLPEPPGDPESVFAEWLDQLVETGDFDSLTGILELTHDALSRLRYRPLVAQDILQKPAS